MSGEVWISGLLSDNSLGTKNGICWKYPNEDWTKAEHRVDDELVAGLYRRGSLYVAGYKQAVEDVPVAGAIWDPKSFAKTGDMFMVGHMYAVKPRLADVFSRFDLGEGGLSPITLYQEDLQTPHIGEYWLLHFGARKSTFIAEESNQENFRVRQLTVDRETGLSIWKTSFGLQDGDVAVSSTALEGADLWVEAQVHSKLFLSGALAEALIQSKPRKVNFDLHRCRVVEG
jgi:hypothetical protein